MCTHCMCSTCTLFLHIHVLATSLASVLYCTSPFEGVLTCIKALCSQCSLVPRPFPFLRKFITHEMWMRPKIQGFFWSRSCSCAKMVKAWDRGYSQCNMYIYEHPHRRRSWSCSYPLSLYHLPPTSIPCPSSWVTCSSSTRPLLRARVMTGRG